MSLGVVLETLRSSRMFLTGSSELKSNGSTGEPLAHRIGSADIFGGPQGGLSMLIRGMISYYMGVSINGGTPRAGWFIRETPNG